MSTTRVVNNYIYPRKAVIEAREAYKSYCNVTLRPLSSGNVELTLDAKKDYIDSDREVVLGFLNYMLDKSVEIQTDEH